MNPSRIASRPVGIPTMNDMHTISAQRADSMKAFCVEKNSIPIDTIPKMIGAYQNDIYVLLVHFLFSLPQIASAIANEPDAEVMRKQVNMSYIEATKKSYRTHGFFHVAFMK